MKVELRFKVCDEEGVLRRFATKNEAAYFMRGKDDLKLEVEKRKKKVAETVDNLMEFGESVF